MTTQNEIIAFDFETTGLSSQYNEIMEYAFLRMVDGIVIDKISSLVKPKIPITPRITAFNKITNEMLKDKQPMTEHIQVISEFIGDRDLVAHNASFDKRFLNVALYNAGINQHYNRVFCSMNLANRIINQKYGPKLVSSLELLGITPEYDSEVFHRAEFDSYCCGLVYFKTRELILIKNPDKNWHEYSTRIK